VSKVPSPFAFIGCPLFKEGFITSMPSIEKITKPTLRNFAQIRGNSFQRFGSFTLGIASQIPCHNLLLMEMAHLYRQRLKEPIESPSPVDCDCLDNKAFLCNLLPNQIIFPQGFGLNKAVGDGQTGLGVFGNQKPESSSPLSKVGCIDDQDNIPGFERGTLRLILVNLLLNPLSGTMEFLGKILENGTVKEILFKQDLAQPVWSSGRRKNLSAIQA